MLIQRITMFLFNCIMQICVTFNILNIFLFTDYDCSNKIKKLLSYNTKRSTLLLRIKFDIVRQIYVNYRKGFCTYESRIVIIMIWLIHKLSLSFHQLLNIECNLFILPHVSVIMSVIIFEIKQFFKSFIMSDNKIKLNKQNFYLNSSESQK